MTADGGRLWKIVKNGVGSYINYMMLTEVGRLEGLGVGTPNITFFWG